MLLLVAVRLGVGLSSSGGGGSPLCCPLLLPPSPLQLQLLYTMRQVRVWEAQGR